MGENSVNLVGSPLEAMVLLNDKEHPAKIVKVAPIGVMVDVDVAVFRIQQRVKLKFSLKDGQPDLDESMVVVKIHNRYRNEKLYYLVELHFKTVSLELKDRLDAFIKDRS